MRLSSTSKDGSHGSRKVVYMDEAANCHNYIWPSPFIGARHAR